jgi:hypothetical protein
MGRANARNGARVKSGVKNAGNSLKPENTALLRGRRHLPEIVGNYRKFG